MKQMNNDNVQKQQPEANWVFGVKTALLVLFPAKDNY